MKTLKILFLLCIASFITFLNAFSQTTDLNPEQLREFNQKKLSLEVTGVGMGSYGSGNISYSSWTKWNAYHGFKSISESTLYSIAGYDDLALMAQKREKKGKTLLYTGLGLMGGGLVVMLASSGSDSFAGVTIGGATAMVGVVVGYMSIGINSTNMKPYGVASGIVDEYNLNLSISIKKSF